MVGISNKTTVSNILRSINSICVAMGDFKPENDMFAKYLLFLNTNQNRSDMGLALHTCMNILASMVQHFDLSSEITEDTWNFIHSALEQIMDRNLDYTLNGNENAIHVISGSLLMMTKIWIR